MSTLKQRESRNLVGVLNEYEIFAAKCLFIARRERATTKNYLLSRSVDDVSDNVTKAEDGNVCSANEGRCARTNDGRNSIIASREGFARRQECCARDEPWICIRRLDDNDDNGGGGWCEESDANRRRRRRCRRMSSPTTTTTATKERRSPEARNSSSKCSLRNGGDVGASTMKADKKLGNVLASWTWRPTRTSSYSELYRRRFG